MQFNIFIILLKTCEMQIEFIVDAFCLVVVQKSQSMSYVTQEKSCTSQGGGGASS